MRRFVQVIVSAGALVLCAQPSRAQDVPLSELLTRFFTPANPLILANPDHAAHFISQTGASETLGLLNKNIAYQLSSFPLGSSSGGFTFELDPTLGTLSRSTESFGPLFAERALTSGKGKLTVGSSYTHATWDRFEGNKLDEGAIQLTLTHFDIPGDNHFEGDLIDADFFLGLKTNTLALFANYGVTDHFDIGVAVPIQRVEMDARIHTTVLPLATARDATPVHFFQGGSLEHDFFESGDASGIGDIVLRGKLGITPNVAAAVDVRLATGDAEDLLGSGSTQVKGFLILSGGKSKFSPHLNVGYTFTGESDVFGELPDEFNYTGGFDAALAPRVTLTADLVGRALLNADRLVPVDHVYRYRFANEPTGSFTHTETRTELGLEEGTLNLLLGSVGLKFNPAGRLLISGNVLLSLSKDNGLQDLVTPVFQVDYNF
jgi:hypothetical protein